MKRSIIRTLAIAAVAVIAVAVVDVDGSNSSAPTATAISSIDPDQPPLDGRIPEGLRGRDRTAYMLRHWQSLAGPDLGEFAFAHMHGRTLHAGHVPLTMPLAVVKALPELLPGRFGDPQFADFGFLADPADPLGLPVGLKTGGTRPRYVGLSCAACHTGLVRGRLTPGAPNDALRFGAFVLAWEAALGDARLEYEGVRSAAGRTLGALPEDESADLKSWLADRPRPQFRTDAERAAIAAWGAGRARYETRGVPARIPSLWHLGRRYHSDGAWSDLGERNRHALWRLGVPLEAVRSTESTRLLRALPEYLAAMVPPEPWPAADRRQAALGAELYRANCASCHDRPGELLPIELVGTDDRLARGESPIYRAKLRLLGFEAVDIRFWPMIKIPPLEGVSALRQFFHNGSVRSLEDVLAPAGRPPVVANAGAAFDTRLPGHSNRGHSFGSDLDAADRHALSTYLKTL